MNRKVLLVVASAAALAACDGFKEAMTAHVDVAARAGSQELSVERLAELLGASKVPLNRDVARAVADLWVDYQLLARAAAQGDTVMDTALVKRALWAEIENLRARKWYDVVSKTWVPDAATEAAYNQGDLLAARHILIMVPQQGLSTAKQDSLRRVAEQLRQQVTPANFAAIASQRSMDPGSKDKGGYLGIFPRGVMVPEFEQAVLSLKPGEISQPIRTQFGWHIIQRSRYEDVKDEFGAAYNERYGQIAEQKYLEGLQAAGNIEVRPNAPQVVKAVAKDVDEHVDDKTVIATSKAGDFTAGRLARWLKAFPPQAQITAQIQAQPDSVIAPFVEKLVTNELVLAQADSAKVELDPTEMAQVVGTFETSIRMAWNALGIQPAALADSAKTPAARVRIASERVDQYMSELLAERARYVDVPEPVSDVLHAKYDAKVNAAGIDRAVERAVRVRAAMDSTRAPAAGQTPSQVPMPPTPVTPGAEGAQPMTPRTP